MAHRKIGASEGRLDALQSLRGIAASVVLVRHAFLSYPVANAAANSLIAVLFNSHAAVVVFFVLSGFVLSISLDRRGLTTRSFVGFYIKRGFRILPLLILITVASIVYTESRMATSAVPGGSTFLTNILPYGAINAKIALLSLFGMNSHYVPQNWTLMVELLVTIIFPFAFFSMRKSKVAAATLLGLAAVASLSAHAGEHWLPISGGHWLPIIYTVDFLLGIETFLLWSRAPKPTSGVSAAPPRLLWPIAAALLLVTVRPIVFALGLPFIDSNDFHDAPTALAEALAAAGLILLIARGRAFHILTHRALVFLGDISFSVYLVHFLVIVVAVRLLAAVGPGFDTLDGLARNAILATAVLAVSIGLSVALYHFVEMPWNALGNRLAEFVRRPQAKPMRVPSEVNATVVTD